MSTKKNKQIESKAINFYYDGYYINRELSWLQFNSRCLSEAKDKSTPLFEKLKFLSITASNLDEFFMVRVASLKDMINAGYKKPDIAGLSPKEQLERVTAVVHDFENEQYKVYNRLLLPELGENGVEVVRDYKNLNAEEADYIDRYFDDFVYPVLTPMAVDSSRPFPLIRNKTLNIGALVKAKDNDEMEFAMVQVPSVLPRIMEIPEQSGVRKIMLLEQIIQRNIRKLFLNYDIVCCYPFRVGRNADLSIDEDEAEDLLKEIEKQLKRRQWGQAIRLEVEKGFDKRLLKILVDELKVEQSEIYTVDGPLDLTFLMKLYGIEGFDYLKEHGYNPPAPVPELPLDRDIFACIREGDILMHHPYESFDPVVRFVETAASDPAVLAIKQTLYRVSGNSPIIAALAKAADNGKQVSVLVELKARFDEENNIVWAKMLEKAGCHVIYGLKGLKTHSKITLVVRKEEDGIRRYVHLATGNYNDSTAKLYTDVGMFTCAEAYGEDATAVFNMLSGYSEPVVWNKLTLAPLWLKDRVLDLIKREAEHAKNGEPAHIIAKMNSICHKDVIAALYEASSVGVKIDLIVRGICCLRTGIPGVSENISVRSIVGNFLEHSRIFYFENGGSPEYYASSADWMPRNLERRVEIMFPVENPELRKKLWHILDSELNDNVKAHIMNKEGEYVKVTRRGQDPLNSQKLFGKEATQLSKPKDIAENRVFEPEYRDDHGL
ncbi:MULTISPECIES: RNA degradosome polyphosphate kinase [unclassified Butyrivibrio]|uniref:RNA degradosome polyphosphate kinase n=1 Tax=unclassified Butyrivibrio TaxID=2639466 RepID=UPI0004012EAF|nr:MULTISPECIES: RNA degradosome polyphosphate kinase [unclassified Butyrivibrio]MCR5343264.1 RNA degradosome polyphosphate kinase [Butyrivibrio sp.]